MNIHIDEVTFWLLVIVALILAVLSIVSYRFYKRFSRRCTEEGCHSLRVERTHKIILLEKPQGFWRGHFWVKAETFTLTHCKRCGKRNLEKSPTKYISRWHILWVELTDPRQLKMDEETLKFFQPGRGVFLERMRRRRRPFRLRYLEDEDEFKPHDLDLS